MLEIVYRRLRPGHYVDPYTGVEIIKLGSYWQAFAPERDGKTDLGKYDTLATAKLMIERHVQRLSREIAEAERTASAVDAERHAERHEPALQALAEVDAEAVATGGTERTRLYYDAFRLDLSGTDRDRHARAIDRLHDVALVEDAWRNSAARWAPETRQRRHYSHAINKALAQGLVAFERGRSMSDMLHEAALGILEFEAHALNDRLDAHLLACQGTVAGRPLTEPVYGRIPPQLILPTPPVVGDTVRWDRRRELQGVRIADDETLRSVLALAPPQLELVVVVRILARLRQTELDLAQARAALIRAAVSR